ncbi:MAG: class I SAM-dependent methyltransferase [Deltaproteobacteria bacterium]|nr:class I SAM-dependent methyltransferase [Deltaproteobacteria bacterium]
MENRSYYDEFSQWYERERGQGYHQMIDDLELAAAIPFARDRRVLEVGCGTGLILMRLAEVAREAKGIDLSPGMLEHARSKGLDVQEASATSLPFDDDSFDLTCSFKVLAHVEDIGLALSEMARVTAPGGTILAEFYNPYSLRYLAKTLGPAGKISAKTTESAVYTRYDSPSQARALCPAGFEFVRFHGVRTVTPAAAVFRSHSLGALFRQAELAVRTTPLANLAGFLVAEYRRR